MLRLPVRGPVAFSRDGRETDGAPEPPLTPPQPPPWLQADALPSPVCYTWLPHGISYGRSP